MKSKDQTLLEEAYNKTRLLKEEGESMTREGDSVNSLNDWNDQQVAANKTSIPGIDSDTEKMYWNAFGKFKNDEITSQQWGDICTKLLGDLMEQNRDVFVRLKNR